MEYKYDWGDRTVGERAMEAARAGLLNARQQSDVVLALIGLAEAYDRQVDAQEGEGAHQHDEYSMGARAALLGILQPEKTA